jgi:predicted MFS family arabinose efflux permease
MLLLLLGGVAGGFSHKLNLVLLAPAIGPSIGGLLVDWFGWRSTFFMVVPFCLASLYMGRQYIPSVTATSTVVRTSRLR